jgi:hypothetical protein
MNDEAALKLAAAMDRLAAAIESVRGLGLVGGIQVHHHNAPVLGAQPYQQPWPPFGPNWSSCGNDTQLPQATGGHRG